MLLTAPAPATRTLNFIATRRATAASASRQLQATADAQNRRPREELEELEVLGALGVLGVLGREGLDETDELAMTPVGADWAPRLSAPGEYSEELVLTRVGAAWAPRLSAPVDGWAGREEEPDDDWP